MSNQNQPSSPKKTPFNLFNLLPLIAIFLTSLIIAQMVFENDEKSVVSLKFPQVWELVQKNQVLSISYEKDGMDIKGIYKDEKTNKEVKFKTVGYIHNDYYLKELANKNIIPEFLPPEKPSIIKSLFLAIFNVMIFVLIFKFFMGGGIGSSNGKNPFSFGKANFKGKSQSVFVQLKDVAGIEEAKEELVEIVDYLKNAEKYKKLGAKIPRGALLVGPPGTGKTMLAKALATEAQANFLSMSGSEFVEMFVGVGASRIRDLFNEAKKTSPCIIFIDEIDAIGKSRDGKGMSGGHDEKEQTLNQLLVEMDGFDTTANVIVLAATNRVEVLDKALLRPGRFDRTIYVNLPDLKGREKILEVHAQKIKLAPNTNLETIAKGTAGFSGAELANLINEAAIIAAKNGKEMVSVEDLEYARDKVMMGPERKSLVMSEKEKVTTAYHEIGHTLISMNISELDKVHKVSIIPRGRALGVTQTIAEENQLSLSKNKAISMIAMLMGGRAAEQLKFDHFTTGASNDIERATNIARRMVCDWGMSILGPINLNKEHNGLISAYDFSEKTKQEIDSQINYFLKEGYNLAMDILVKNKDLLELLSLELLKKETLDSNDLKLLVDNFNSPKMPTSEV